LGVASVYPAGAVVQESGKQAGDTKPGGSASSRCSTCERDGEWCYDTSPVIDADGALLGRTRMAHITDYPDIHEQDYYTLATLDYVITGGAG
jgi:predicted amidohydrolase